MKPRLFPVFIVILALGGATCATPLLAQNTTKDQGLGGTPPSGLCMLSREAVFANSKVGIAVSARLKQLADAAQSEIEADRKPVEAEFRGLQAEAAKLKPEQVKAREAALQPKVQAIQTKTTTRSREIELTRTKVMEMISVEAQPVIAEVYKKRACGLLIDRNTVLGGNFTNDLTSDVVRSLDAKITTLTFERETLPSGTSRNGT
ncbi:OmpH family outer membrane protein [Asticcacaulis sp. SL142]|uniref:OmpH family outer membrane protein n=1 Tax=Asticcacaulis sp. SL142 TaxID=2995155 RepID=UPI00226CA229|nr:OmpH family outer membrane protein [Asticcacaulis sp. SL142]WAC49185.1 OmpH family outer membrane protein [Asticcacaulis sp. SL142]